MDKGKLKQMKRFYSFLMKRELTSSKFRVVLLLMFAMCGSFYYPLTIYLLQADDRIGVWEMAGSLFYSTDFAGLVYFVAVIALIGNIPHRSEDTIYYLFRGSRKNWLCANVLFLVTESIIYYVVLIVYTGVYCLPGITIKNEWSALYRGELNKVYQMTGIFPGGWVQVCTGAIRSTTPVAFLGRNFLLIVLCTVFIGMVGLVFNIYGKRRWGLFLQVMLVIAHKLLLAGLDVPQIFSFISCISWLDPVSFISAKWNNPTGGYSNTLYQILYLYLTIGGMYLLSLRHIWKTDWT